jgi:hypothetical protein
MLGMVFLLPVVFTGLIWHSYRSARQRAARGEAFQPAGKRRWPER